jgi:hypothetical protein
MVRTLYLKFQDYQLKKYYSFRILAHKKIHLLKMK